ncbi:hypothetical protein HDU86_001316 [Geranomyces michiganensis]|nr:hypothetical protein HDU86_001316 [Geranomyces michiganensis]
MDPSFEGSITSADASHIHTRLMGGLHRLLSGSYTTASQKLCSGKAFIGAGRITMVGRGHVLGIGFGTVSVLLAIFMFLTQRDIQLMVGARNFGRAISALSSPLRFAALLDRTKASGAFAGMCDDTPDALAAVGSSLLVSLGGDIYVGGRIGHACISTIENVDVFSTVRTYKGKPSNTAHAGLTELREKRQRSEAASGQEVPGVEARGSGETTEMATFRKASEEVPRKMEHVGEVDRKRARVQEPVTVQGIERRGEKFELTENVVRLGQHVHRDSCPQEHALGLVLHRPDHEVLLTLAQALVPRKCRQSAPHEANDVRGYPLEKLEHKLRVSFELVQAVYEKKDRR